MKLSKLIYCTFLIFFIACKNNPAPGSKNSIAETKTKDTVENEIILESFVGESLLLDYDTTEWTDIAFVNPSIIVDMKYASIDNFVKSKMYDCSRCFLRPKVANAVLKAQKILNKKGLGLKLFDCYRPHPVQEKLWEKVPNAAYVTPPEKGSMHNRGCAVDVTIVDQNGMELEMGTAFDFFW